MNLFQIRTWRLLLPVFWLCCGSAFAQPLGEGTQLYVDGKNITDKARFELLRDDLVRFDAYGLQGGSTLELQGRKGGGPRFYKQAFQANARGEIKAILFFPKVGSTIIMEASYTAEDGEAKEIRFDLEPTGYSPRGKRRSKTGRDSDFLEGK